MADTPNMALPLPSPSVTPGPTWAQDLNDCFELVDSHDHTTGRGVAVTPAALNINASVDFQANAATDVDSIQFSTRNSDTSANDAVYVKAGELFFKDASANAVQLTSGGSIAGASGSFTGLTSPAAATYSSSSKLFSWTYDSAKYAKSASADLVLYPYNASTAYTKAITVKAPVGLEALASYTLSLPSALPASAELMTVDNAGLVDHASISGTANQISVAASATAVTLSLPSTVATTILQAGSGAVGAPSHAFSTDTTTGLYRFGAGAVGFASSGSQVAGYGTQGLFLKAGSAATPSLFVITDSDTGLYSAGTDSLGISAGGAVCAAFSPAGAAVTGAISATTSVSSGTSVSVGTSLSIGTTIETAGGGAFKVSIYTGSIAANTVGTISVGAAIYGYNGNSTFNGTSSYLPIQYDAAKVATTADSIYTLGGGSTTITLYNYDSNTTNSYRVVVFHA